jgi:predicted TIM-barrel fold metal-dependent hydrolase
MPQVLISRPSPMPLEETISYNTYFTDLVKKYPKRFAALASAVPFGGKPAFYELERSVKDLGLKGFIICATIDGQPLDSRQFWPFYQKVSELKVPIFIHPSGKPPGFEALKAPYDLSRTMGREFDLALATFRLCAGGVLEEFPDLKFVIAHFGGGFSSIKERMDRYSG